MTGITILAPPWIHKEACCPLILPKITRILSEGHFLYHERKVTSSIRIKMAATIQKMTVPIKILLFYLGSK
jgi:hypothetical protein